MHAVVILNILISADRALEVFFEQKMKVFTTLFVSVFCAIHMNGSFSDDARQLEIFHHHTTRIPLLIHRIRERLTSRPMHFNHYSGISSSNENNNNYNYWHFMHRPINLATTPKLTTASLIIDPFVTLPVTSFQTFSIPTVTNNPASTTNSMMISTGKIIFNLFEK